MSSTVNGLDIKQLEDADAVTLRRLWAEVNGSTPPKTFTARLMRMALAWDAQAALMDGETAKTRRAWNRIIRNRCGHRGGNGSAIVGLPKVCEGTRLLKEWGGMTHEVLVTADGCAVWNEQSYSSLSAVARAMTGTNRNGPKFFGLREEGKQ